MKTLRNIKQKENSSLRRIKHMNEKNNASLWQQSPKSKSGEIIIIIIIMIIGNMFWQMTLSWNIKKKKKKRKEKQQLRQQSNPSACATETPFFP